VRAAGAYGEIRIAPSILSADFGSLAEAVRGVDAQTDWVHVDVMDGHFVRNITIGPPVVRSLRPYSEKFFDCHLMIREPERYLEAFAKAGADGCTVHAEVGNTPALVRQMRDLGLRVGVALNPDSPLDLVLDVINDIDLLLCMTVFPGFGGQRFMADVVPKVASARDIVRREGLELDIEVDGGIDAETAPIVVRAGANVLVAGNAIFAQENPLEAAARLRTTAESV
jgi:ribulose-phosphate 3-epimerase